MSSATQILVKIKLDVIYFRLLKTMKNTEFAFTWPDVHVSLFIKYLRAVESA